MANPTTGGRPPPPPPPQPPNPPPQPPAQPQPQPTANSKPCRYCGGKFSKDCYVCKYNNPPPKAPSVYIPFYVAKSNRQIEREIREREIEAENARKEREELERLEKEKEKEVRDTRIADKNGVRLVDGKEALVEFTKEKHADNGTRSRDIESRGGAGELDGSKKTVESQEVGKIHKDKDELNEENKAGGSNERKFTEAADNDKDDDEDGIDSSVVEHFCNSLQDYRETVFPQMYQLADLIGKLNIAMRD